MLTHTLTAAGFTAALLAGVAGQAGAAYVEDVITPTIDVTPGHRTTPEPEIITGDILP